MNSGARAHHDIIIVGAGPVGLTMALDWAQRGRDVLVLAANDALSEGSRAICFSKRTLEICDRLGFGDAVAAQGVSWNVGKVFLRDDLLYEFNLLPEPGHSRPAFVNLQQYHFEHHQLEALARYGDRVDLRWGNRVTAVEQREGCVDVTVHCAAGDYKLTCDWLIACDGAGSPVRKMLGLTSEGQVFRDRFLIADVKITKTSRAIRNERWFWFDPPFHRNQSALLHRQADDVWRLDFQLGWQADPDVERQPERVLPRVRAMLGAHFGDDVEFSLEWVSVYTFQCRRMERFVHDRVIFAGDSAHQVSPFGARGANSGIQDADNLGWKLDLVVRGLAPARLLDSYDAERSVAADENILNSTRSTDFITPKNEVSRTFRDATLELAAKYPFARKLVNSGRLSVPSHYDSSALNADDVDEWAGAASRVAPGSPAPDAPVMVARSPARPGLEGKANWLLPHLGGTFSVAVFAPAFELPGNLLQQLDRVAREFGRIGPGTHAAGTDSGIRIVVISRRTADANGSAAADVIGGSTLSGAAGPTGSTRLADATWLSDVTWPTDVTWLTDASGAAFERYAPNGAAVYLIRPDQHVAARRACLDAAWIPSVLRRACAIDDATTDGAADGNSQSRTEPLAAG